MQDTIAKIIKDFDSGEVLSDWQDMTLRQILSAMEMPGRIVFWGCWSETELSTVFRGV